MNKTKMQTSQKLQLKKGNRASISEVALTASGSSCHGGFSFIESMLSIAVLSFGIIAVLPLITSGLRESFDSRDQLIGAMLAQEGAELVQNIRDNNWAGDEKFDANFPGTKNNCTVSYESDEIKNGQDCKSSSEHYILKFGGGFYNHSIGDDTKFRRKIELDFEGSSPDQTLEVISMVIWGSSFPGSTSGCNTASKCAYSTLTLTEWASN